jgi:hypothetical protein
MDEIMFMNECYCAHVIAHEKKREVEMYLWLMFLTSLLNNYVFEEM